MKIQYMTASLVSMLAIGGSSYADTVILSDDFMQIRSHPVSASMKTQSMMAGEKPRNTVRTRKWNGRSPAACYGMTAR